MPGARAIRALLTNPLTWIFVVLSAVPMALAFVPDLPTHGYGHVWYLIPLWFLWRKPAERRRLLLYIAGVLLWLIAFPDPDLGFLGWILLWPYLLAREQDDGANWWRAAYLFGFLRAHAGFYWLGNIHFAPWWGVSLGSSIIFVLFVEGSLRWLKPIPYALRAGIGWVLFDWAHSWFFGGFPWLYPAHTQYRALPVIQIADVVGAHGVTFLMVFLQAAAFDSIRRRRLGMELPVAAAMLVATLIYGFTRIEKHAPDRPSFLMVQSAFPHSVKKYTRVSRREVFNILMDLTAEGLEKHPDTDLVIWPETMHPIPLVETEPGRFESAARAFARRFKTPVIYGINVYPDREHIRKARSYNAVILADAQGRLSEPYLKQRLVPMGEEFLPRRFLSPEAADAAMVWLHQNIGYPRTVDLLRGDRATVLDAGEGLRCGPLICFEGLYSDLARDAVQAGEVDFILHLVNNGWFGRSWEERQCVASWVFRAIETRTPFLSCANGGISCAVAPDGEVFVRLDKVMETGVAWGRVPPRWSEPLFLRGGRWVLPLGLGLAGAFFLVSWEWKRRRERGARAAGTAGTPAD